MKIKGLTNCSLDVASSNSPALAGQLVERDFSNGRPALLTFSIFSVVEGHQLTA
jgi:hypothetical protein